MLKSKQNFMYKLRQEDMEYIEDGHKYRGIIKIIEDK